MGLHEVWSVSAYIPLENGVVSSDGGPSEVMTHFAVTNTVMLQHCSDWQRRRSMSLLLFQERGSEVRHFCFHAYSCS